MSKPLIRLLTERQLDQALRLTSNTLSQVVRDDGHFASIVYSPDFIGQLFEHTGHPAYDMEEDPFIWNVPVAGTSATAAAAIQNGLDCALASFSLVVGGKYVDSSSFGPRVTPHTPGVTTRVAVKTGDKEVLCKTLQIDGAMAAVTPDLQGFFKDMRIW